jgi:hypothetical protein
MSKDINNINEPVFINHVFNLSKLYDRPISSYARYNEKIILIYSKKSEFINPRNYPKEFIDEMKQLLYDDWTMLKTRNGALEFVDIGMLNHSIPWKFYKNKVEKLRNYNMDKYLYNTDFFSYLDYDNLDSLRIINKD